MIPLTQSRHKPQTDAVKMKDLPLFDYNKKTDRYIGNDTTLESIVNDLEEAKPIGINIIRFKYYPQYKNKLEEVNKHPWVVA